MKATLLCLVVFALVGLSLANEDLDHHLRGDFRKSNAISVVSSGNVHHIFARGLDNKIYYNKFDVTWVGWIALSDILFISAPSAVSWGPGRLDVFAIDTSNRLRHAYFNGAWSSSAWDDLGGYYLPTVRASSYNVGQVSAFVLDLGQRGYVHSWSGAWSTSSLGSLAVDETIVPISWGINRFDLASISKGIFVHTYNTATSWVAWESLSTTTTRYFGVPAVTAWAANRLDVFFLEGSGSVRHYYYSSSWGNDLLPGVYSSDLSAVSWGTNRIDFVGLGADSTLFWTNWNGATWSSPVQISPIVFTSAPTASTGGLGLLSVFGINSVGEVVWGSYNTATLSWSSFTAVGTNKFLA